MSVSTCTVSWREGIPKIETPRIILRPIQPEDKSAYQKLFLNKIAMASYAGGPRDISRRFDGWLQRWQWHHFSALAVVDKSNDRVIGHAVLGHGDYEGKIDRGWSEAAVILHPDYWNKGIGEEIYQSVGAYAKHLSSHGFFVPSDVVESQQAEVEKLAEEGMRVHRDGDGKIQWIYLPFTELRATCHPDNTNAYRLLEMATMKNNGSVEATDRERFLFRFNLKG